jgi:hypothetical protein
MTGVSRWFAAEGKADTVLTDKGSWGKAEKLLEDSLGFCISPNQVKLFDKMIGNYPDIPTQHINGRGALKILSVIPDVAEARGLNIRDVISQKLVPGLQRLTEELAHHMKGVSNWLVAQGRTEQALRTNKPGIGLNILWNELLQFLNLLG